MCHCFAEAVQGVTGSPGTACAKQWHTAVRNAGYFLERKEELSRNNGVAAPPAEMIFTIRGDSNWLLTGGFSRHIA